MYLVELRPGKEELYRTGDDLAAAIRSGEVDGHSRIYHRATSKWISITLHPQYKAIVAEKPAQPADRSDWTCLTAQAETLESAPEPAGSPTTSRPSRRRRRSARATRRQSRGAVRSRSASAASSSCSGFSSPSPARARAGPPAPRPSRASPVTPAAGGAGFVARRWSRSRAPRPRWDEGAGVRGRCRRPRPGGEGAGRAAEGAEARGQVARRGDARLPAGERSRRRRRSRACSPATARPTRRAREPARQRHAGGAAQPALRAVPAHARRRRHRHPARPRRASPTSSGCTGSRRARSSASSRTRSPTLSKDLGWSPKTAKRWYSREGGKESPALVSLTERLLARHRQRARGAERRGRRLQAGGRQDPVRGPRPPPGEYSELRRNINAAMDSARIAGGEESAGPMGYLLKAIGTTRLPQES